MNVKPKEPLIIYLNSRQDPRNRIWCPVCGEGCCQLMLGFSEEPEPCPGGCRHNEVHYLEQFQQPDAGREGWEGG